jgi:hypothetical protein
MDRTTRCPKYGKRMVPVVTLSGRTDLQCISCDHPAVKWAESPLTAPEKPIVAEPVNHSARLELKPGSDGSSGGAGCAKVLQTWG